MHNCSGMNPTRSLRLALLSTCLGLLAAPALRAEMPEGELNALRERAEAGDPIAQHNLGLKYADAKDKYFNLVESYAWLKTAAEHGAAGNALAVVEGQLSPAQRSEAAARLATIAQTIQTKGDVGPAAGVSESPVAPTADPAAEYKKLSEELSGAWKENDQLKAELGRLRAAAANFEGERNGLLEKVRAAEVAVAALKSEAKPAAPDAKAAEALKTAQGQLDEAQLKLEAALNSFAQQQRETDRVQKALVAVEGERASLADKVAQLEKTLDAKPAVAAPDPSLSIRLQAAEGALRQAQAEREQLRAALEAAKASATSSPTVAVTTPAPAAPTETAPVDDETRKTLADTQMKLEVSLRAFAVQREEIDRLQQRIAALEGDKTSLEARLQETGIQVSNTTARAEAGDKAAAELSRLQEQLRQTQNQLASVVTENMQMRDRLALAPRASSGAILMTPMRPGSMAAPEPTPTPAPEARTHQIVPGDTLSRIARRYLGSADRWAEILELNPGLDPAKLPIGETIKLPAR
ncbi:LysM peptidoglycan-binding domain-containing protein [Nibricoccus sp. IMCC34717]|uniref:LysM peptidoglycan-binding domain-containing protein n=1 Tax=Nibricoccus sp. IMCC34717 TaxID=3034021 RepID=UPI00384F1DA4